MYLNINILLGIISYQCSTICALNYPIEKLPRPYTYEQSHKFDDRKLFECIETLDYEHMKKFINQTDTAIIDVRSKKEVSKTGVLPNSHHIPLLEVVTAFRLSSEDFNKKYKFSKPDKNSSIIFSSCPHGIRSTIACHCLHHLGYKKLYNYIEGWCGWNNRTRPIQGTAKKDRESKESWEDRINDFYLGESLEID